MDQIVLLYTTWPDAETAERTAQVAVEAGLAACVNVLPGARSIYRWEGKLQRDAEIVAIFKTRTERADALAQLIVEQHPYETPAVTAIRALPNGSNSAFLDWIRQQTA